MIVTHQSAATIGGVLEALTVQLGDGDELVVVDSGSTDGTVDVVRERGAGATVVQPGANVGFARGCNLGAESTTAPLLLFLNPDARPEPGCLDALRAIAPDHPDWGAWQALVTLDGGTRVNTRGGVVHFLGLAWAGGVGEPVESAPDAPCEVGFASGAALVVRRAVWERVGGFDPAYFMYGEDVDLALRLRLAGHGVGLAPAARVEHDYEFDKGARKWYLLERNRWLTILAVYPAPLLLALGPALLAAEVGIAVVAARGGWLGSKLEAQRWLLGHPGEIVRRRRRVQALRTASAWEFAARLTADLDSPYLGEAADSRALGSTLGAYWRMALRALGSRR